MNYIKRLENEIKEKRAEIVGLRAGLQDLREYLSLPKFQNDTTVQVFDIFARITDCYRIADELVNDQIRINQEG